MHTQYSTDRQYKLEIIQDEDPQSPDDWGDEQVFLVYDHNDFTIEREGFEPKKIYNKCKKLANGAAVYKKKYYVFQVDAYIHSNIHLSLTNTTQYQHGRWDVSSTGYVVVSKSEAKTIEKAEELAQGLLEEWNTYLFGNVYGFILYKKVEYLKVKLPVVEPTESSIETEWEEIDSCWGFYTDDPEDIKQNGILDHLPEDFKTI